MLVDTGARLTCVNKDFVEAAECAAATTFRRSPTTLRLVGADNSALDCTHIAHLPLRLPHTHVVWPVHVVAGLKPNIIAGMDLLAALGAAVDAEKGKVNFSKQPEPTLLVAAHDMQVAAMTTATVKVTAKCQYSAQAVTNQTGVSECIYHNILPGITHLGHRGDATVAAVNPSSVPQMIKKGDILGTFHQIVAPERSWLSEETVLQHIAPVQEPTQPPNGGPGPSDSEKRRALTAKLRVEAPREFRQQYMNLLLEFADVFSLDDSDLGFTSAYEHRIDLTTDNPVHVKQFRIPLAQQEFVEKRVKELEKQNCIEPSTSPYNTPIFAVPKKTMPGQPPQYRLIQDLRKLNEITKVDKHTICDVRACLDKIGELKASVFSSIDLRAGYYQMGLAKESRPFTAFTLPGKGQWQWRVTTMGLTGAPASFSKLIDKVMHNLDFVLRYLDDLLAASQDHPTHLKHLRQALERLRQFGLKINPDKSSFGAKSVEYLGHTVSKEGFTVGEHKFLAIRDFPEPTTKRKVQQFLGLANYFRQLIPSFQKLAGHLSPLVVADHPWKTGPLPPQAKTAFIALKEALLTRPVISFPHPGKPFTLATDAAVGDDNSPGGLGAVLTQQIEGHDRVIAYASRALKQCERSQSAFQLELQAVIWALEHFGPYLRHTTFEVITDHRPVANLSKQQLSALHRLHAKMLEFPCVIKYRPGVLNDIADALSRNPRGQVEAAVSAIADDLSLPNLQILQQADAMCRDAEHIINNAKFVSLHFPQLNQLRGKLHKFQGLLAIHDPVGRYEGRRLLIPRVATEAALQAAHDHALAGHRGINKTLEAVRTRFWWPNLTVQVQDHVQNCKQCQQSKNPANFTKVRPLFPLPVPQTPNERVHADLFGPLPASPSGNKWILTMTCALSKFVRIVALPNKEAQTVAQAILVHWISVFGPMARLVHDQGREFHNALLKALLDWLGIQQRTTSAMAPSVNGEAEVFNKWIASYLRTLSMNKGADWEGHLAALNLAYNSAVHASTKQTPTYVMFGRHVPLPHIDPIPPQRPDGANKTWLRHHQEAFQKSWQSANQALQATADRMCQQQKDIRTFCPMPGERVLLHYPRSALAARGPPKLQQPWVEAVILAQLGPATFLVRPRWSGQHASIAHGNRLKPFFPRTILPKLQWCVDPQRTEHTANYKTGNTLPPARAPLQPQNAARAQSQQTQQSPSLPHDNRARAPSAPEQPLRRSARLNPPAAGQCPVNCPCYPDQWFKKKRKRKRKHGRSYKRRKPQLPPPQRPSDPPQPLFPLPPPPPAPPRQVQPQSPHDYWLRGSPRPDPLPTPKRPASALKRLFHRKSAAKLRPQPAQPPAQAEPSSDSSFSPEEESSESDEFLDAASTPGPVTRSQTPQQPPQPRPWAQAAGPLRRLATSLANFPNPVTDPQAWRRRQDDLDQSFD